MKKLYCILLAVPFLLLAGCSLEDDRVFDKSSAQRVNELVALSFDTLTAAEEGWYFEYYPESQENRNRGGYWFWCKFNDDYTVNAATEFDVNGYDLGEICDSEFDIIKGRGAVLTFNIYNEVLHYWAEPSTALPSGYGGDHEFSICEVTADYIKVKGIKTEKYMHLYKKQPGKTVTEAMTDFQTTGNAATAPAFSATVAGAKTASVTRSNRVFTLTYTYDTGKLDENADPVFATETVKMPFVPNMEATGIKLYQPVTVMGKEIKGFVYDAPNLQFISDDENGIVVLKKEFPPINSTFISYITDARLEFKATADDMCATLLTAYNAANAYLLSAEGESIYGATIGKGLHSSYTQPSIGFACLPTGSTSYYVAGYQMSFTAVSGSSDEIEIKYLNTIGDGSYGTYQSAFLNPFVMPVSNKSPYVMTTDDISDPSWIKFTSKADATFFFTAYY